MTAIKTLDRMELGDQLARAMEPDAWAEYDEGNGICSNAAGWACLESIGHATRVLDLLAEKGAILVPPKGYTNG